MAWTVVQFALLVTFVTVFQTGGSLAFRIETVPQPFNDLIDKELNISCVPDSPTDWAKYIQTIQVVKEDKPIVIVRRNEKIGMGPGSKPNMEAEGHIEADASRSFLRLTINNPVPDDMGTYSCLMVYEDHDYQFRQEKSSANVTLDNQHLDPIVTFLLEKVANLEKTAHNQELLLKQQRDMISEQECSLKQQRDVISEQGKQFKEQEQSLKNAVGLFQETISVVNQTVQQQDQIIAEQQNTILSQKMFLEDLDTKMKEQATKANHQEAEVKDQEMFMIHLNESMNACSRDIFTQGSELKKYIGQQNEKDSFSCAFSAWGTKEGFALGETLAFTKVQLNIGNHYDKITGVFTTPKNGLYVFNLFVQTTKADDVVIYLKVNTWMAAALYGYDSLSGDQSSISTVLLLNAGDKVFPYVRYSFKQGHVDHKYTMFNGYLLKEL